MRVFKGLADPHAARCLSLGFAKIAAQRVGGWSTTVAGLVPAGLCAFAPLLFANLVPMARVAGALVLTLSYAVWCFAVRGRPGDLRIGR